MKIDLVEEGPEATRIAAALREAGLEVDLRTVTDLLADGSRAHLLIVVGDGLGVLDFLRRRQARGGFAQPTFIMGSPDGLPIAGGMARDLGCTRYFPRPVSVPRLVERAAQLLENPGTEIGLKGAPREATVRLSAAPPAGEDSEVISRELEVDPEITGMRPRHMQEQSGEYSEEFSSEMEPAISVRLFEVLRNADKRLFPNKPAVSLLFATGEESARELVSPVLLQEMALPADEEVSFGAFTFLGVGGDGEALAASEIVSVQSRPLKYGTRHGQPEVTLTEQPSAGASERTTGADRLLDDRSVRDPGVRDPGVRDPGVRDPGVGDPSVRDPSSATIDALELGEPSADGLGRRGEVVDAGVLRILWMIIRRKLDVQLRLELGEGIRLLMVIRRGRLVRLGGPVALRAFEMLRRDNMVSGIPSHEARAMELLKQRLNEGLLTRFEYYRLIGSAREWLIHEAVASRGGVFHVRPIGEGEAGETGKVSLGLGALAPVMVEGARQRLGDHRVRRIMSTASGVLSLGPEAPARLVEAALEPEITELILDYEGMSLEAIIASAPMGTGVPGLMFALYEIGAIDFVEKVARPSEMAANPTAVREGIESLYGLAAEHDYFRILGVGPEAELRQVEVAYGARLAQIQSLPVGPNSELAGMRDEFLVVVQQAYRVLREAPMRRAYRDALYPRGDQLGQPVNLEPILRP